MERHEAPQSRREEGGGTGVGREGVVGLGGKAKRLIRAQVPVIPGSGVAVMVVWRWWWVEDSCSNYLAVAWFSSPCPQNTAACHLVCPC